jgi:hypothetical protein
MQTQADDPHYKTQGGGQQPQMKASLRATIAFSPRQMAPNSANNKADESSFDEKQCHAILNEVLTLGANSLTRVERMFQHTKRNKERVLNRVLAPCV